LERSACDQPAVINGSCVNRRETVHTGPQRYPGPLTVWVYGFVVIRATENKYTYNYETADRRENGES